MCWFEMIHYKGSISCSTLVRSMYFLISFSSYWYYHDQSSVRSSLIICISFFVCFCLSYYFSYNVLLLLILLLSILVGKILPHEKQVVHLWPFLFCDMQNNGPQKYPCLISRTCEYVSVCGKRDHENMIQWRTLTRIDYPRPSG